MMNISYISTYPPTRCGIGIYTSYLCRDVLEIGKEVRVLVIAEKGASEIKTKNFETSPCFDRKEEYVKKIAETLSGFSPHVVHIQHEFAIFNPDERFLNLLEVLKKKTKVVLTLHTVHTNETSDWEGMNMNMGEYNCRMSQLVDAIIVHQNSMKEALIKQGMNEELIHIIPHGTEILEKVDKAESRKKLGLPEDGRIILSFGFFGRYKSKELIIEALPKVLEEIPHAYVFFSGYPREWVREDFETRKLCEEKAKEHGVRNHVIFAKRFIPNEEVHLVFGSSDVVVLPYFQKYFSASGSLHLAIGAFKPVVVSRISKFEEAWKEISNEIIFDFNDSSKLAKILVRLMVDNNFRDSIIKSVRSYALKTSWDGVARVHAQLYKFL